MTDPFHSKINTKDEHHKELPMDRSRPRRNPAAYVLTAIVALALNMAATPATASVPAVLQQVPADAPMVLVVPSLSALSQKVATLHDALGLQVPQMTDALGEFKRMTGIENGMDDNGAIAVVFTDATRLTANQGPPPVILLAPVTDYNAFVANYGGSGAEPITSLALPSGQAVFAKQFGNYAGLSADQQIVEAFGTAPGGAHLPDGLVPAITEQLVSSDAALLIQAQTFAPMLQVLLQGAMAQADQEMTNDFQRSGMDPGMAAIARTVIHMYGDAANAVLRDTQTLLVSIDLSNEGVGLTKVLDFKPGSSLANLVANKSGASAYLDKFAQRPYLAAFALSLGNQDPAVAEWIDYLATKFDGLEAGWLTDLIKPSIELIKPVNGFASVYYQPQQAAMMSGGMIQAVNMIDVQDAPAYLGQYQAYLEKINGLSINIGPQGLGAADDAAPAMAMSISTQYTPGVLQIDGVSVDDYQIKYEFPPQVMQQMGPAAPMMMMMGGMGQGGYMAVKDNYVLMTTVRDAELLKKSLEAIGNGTGLGSTATIVSTRQALPSDSAYEMYVSIPGMINGTVNMFMTMMGQPPIQVPADLAPIAMGAGVEGSTLTGRLFVPMPVIQFARDLGDQFKAMNSGNVGPTAGHPGPGTNQDGPPPAPFR